MHAQNYDKTRRRILSLFDWKEYTDQIQKDFASGSSIIGSSMIWGCQYDQILKFVNGKKDGSGVTFNVNTAYGTRHTGGNTFKTGNNSVDKVQNIYDLEGCTWEWTLEANHDDMRTGRSRIKILRSNL